MHPLSGFRSDQTPSREKQPAAAQEEDSDFPRMARWYHVAALGLNTGIMGCVTVWNLVFAGGWVRVIGGSTSVCMRGGGGVGEGAGPAGRRSAWVRGWWGWWVGGQRPSACQVRCVSVSIARALRSFPLRPATVTPLHHPSRGLLIGI